MSVTASAAPPPGSSSQSGRRPSLPPMPDLSHLTDEERKIIESVIQRQKEEEEKEQEILRALQDDFENYQQSVKKLSEETKQLPTQSAYTPGSQGAICEICHKTKFADGVGHKCHYCGVRSCARCGGKIALRSNKVNYGAGGCCPRVGTKEDCTMYTSETRSTMPKVGKYWQELKKILPNQSCILQL